MIAVIAAVSLGVSAFLYACSDKTKKTTAPQLTPGMSQQNNETPIPSPNMSSAQPSDNKKEEESAVQFEEKVFEFNGRPNRVFILTVDITEPGISVEPYLSFNRIFGFENLRDMAEKTGAVAAVNSGFFFEYGRPSGLVVIDGEAISPGTGKFQSLVIENGKARFEIIESTIVLKVGTQEITLDMFNQPPGGSSAVFSSIYGSTDRLGYLRKVLIIENGIVLEYRIAEKAVKIPKNGYVIALPSDHTFSEDPAGFEAVIDIIPSFSPGAMAYECASMLVKDGISMAGDTMPWVGNLNHYDPRTCVGIFEDGKLGFVVIDGRQDDYSSGTTGRETADVLIELGFTDAVMLDGGGSSQMIYEDNTVNSPSSGPDGRPLAGGFMIFMDK